MSKLKDNSLQYKTEIKHGFEAFEPGNNDCIESEKLNEYINSMNPKSKNTFLYNSIKSLTSQKYEENDDKITLDEYISFIDDQLNDTQSREGLKKIFSLFCEPNQTNFSWTKFPLIAKELGDKDMANKLLKLLEHSKLYTKDVNFKEFCDIMKDDYIYNKKKLKKKDMGDYEDVESYKQKKRKNKNKEEEEEMGTISSKNSYKDKNEDNKKSGEDNDGEKSSKRYHRRYRDSKNKNENNESGKNINKTHFKYRKKH